MIGRCLAGLCALGLAACAVPVGAGGSAAPAESIAGTRWLGVVDSSTDARILPRLQFESGGRLAGFTGCNMLSGSWRLEGGEVRLGAIAATKRYCVGAAGEIEKRLLAALNDRSRITRESGKLVVLGPDGARFEFTPE